MTTRDSDRSDPAATDLTSTDPVSIALTVVAQFEAGQFAEAEKRFAQRLRVVAPASTLAGLWRDEIRGRQILGRGEVSVQNRPDGLITATVPLLIDSGGMDVLISVDNEGMLHGLRFAPPADSAWTAPAYANPHRHREHEVLVGSGASAVPGTVTLPGGGTRLLGRMRGGAPAVVLLVGGGPFDRDGTAGPNKPLKDLAWGLAAQGIAVLRFDKSTFVYGEEMNERGFTLADEYVPHAVAAVRLLQSQGGVDPRRVFVLGHSAGGKAAPLVAQSEPSVAGIVVLAGDAHPLHETAVRVGRHVAALNPGPDADAALARLTEQAARAADPNLDAQTPAEQIPFGLPAAYWLNLREYDPVATAASMAKPMFIAQGGRDYQVTVDHDLALWRRGLGERAGIKYRIYPADDHLFFPGTEPATPTSYKVAQHVDPELIADIAAWLRSRP